MAKQTKLPVEFIGVSKAKNGTYSWAKIDRRRKTGKKDNSVYSSHAFNTKSAANKAARNHVKTLRVKLEIVDLSKA